METTKGYLAQIWNKFGVFGVALLTTFLVAPQLLVADPVDLALHKDYLSSDPNQHGWDKPGLTDGVEGKDPENCFATDDSPNFPKNVTVDLGSIQPFTTVVFGVPPFGSTKTVDVSVSADGTTFTPFGEYVFKLGEPQRAVLKGTAQARYVRLTYVDHYSQQNVYGNTYAFTSELEVYNGDAPPAPPPPLLREECEWCDLWMPHFPENKLPRVLLIGDSITRGYSGAVDKLLDGKAYVFRLADSHFLNDPMLMTEIAMVLDNQKFDVVHFNNGMHGWQYSEDDYRKYFPGFLDVIRKHAGHAKLIWATTTPLKVDNQAAPGSPVPTNARIAARNAIALEFITPFGIPVDNRNALVAGHPEYHDADTVHFNDKGVNVQAAQVAAEIQKLLPP